jgi:hypothetical protein
MEEGRCGYLVGFDSRLSFVPCSSYRTHMLGVILWILHLRSWYCISPFSHRYEFEIMASRWHTDT